MKSNMNTNVNLPKVPGMLARKLAQLRGEAGLTLYQLEQRSGINRPKLMRIENGTVRFPTTATLDKIAVGLGVAPFVLHDAAWAEHSAPLPSLSTYLHSKLGLSDEQVHDIEHCIQNISNKSLL
jgi:transcriptional regulator with XRE-family HTH domain